MTWVQQTPFNDADSGTSPGTAAPISGGTLSMTVGGGAAWSSAASGRRFDINDNLAWSWIGGSTIDAWFHGSQTCAFGCIVNDPRSGNKTWFEATGTTGMDSTTYHSFGLNVSSTGVVTVRMCIPGTGVVSMIVSDADVVSANTDTYALIVFDSAAASSDDYIQLYINGARITPATYNGSTLGGLTLVWNQGSNAAFWVGGGTASAATLDNYIAWFEAATHAPSASEVSDRWDQLAADNDTEPSDEPDVSEFMPCAAGDFFRTRLR
jgi:hypothetical protein